MPVLTQRETWKRPKTSARYTPDLTPEEIDNVRRALKVLRTRFGGYAQLAEAMGAKVKTVETSVSRKSGPSVATALRAARVAGVPLEEILRGAWPKPGACPMCGRCDPAPDAAK